MITLNTEHGLVKIESWCEVEELAGFKGSLDSKQHVLKEVIGRYHFRDKKRCGLSHCHSPHNRGYIVNTEEGYKTNIGNVCGRKYFGVDFDVQSKEFDVRVEEQENRDVLFSFQSRIDLHLSQINEMISGEYGASWISKSLRSYKNNTHTSLQNMINNASKIDGKVFIERELTDEEKEIQENVNSNSMFTSELVTKLEGISILEEKEKLRCLLFNELKENLDVLITKDIESMDGKDLKHWTKWISEIESNIKVANNIIENGREFFRQENLKPLKVLVEDPKERRSFEKWCSSL